MDTSRLARHTLLLWLINVLFFGGVAWWLAQDRIETRRLLATEAEIRNVARSAESIAMRVDRVVRDVRFLATYESLRHALATDAPEPLAALRDGFVAFSSSQGGYDQIRWIDERGMERVRVDLTPGGAVAIPAERLQDKGRQPLFTAVMALSPGEIYISPPDLNVEQDRVEVPHTGVLRVGTPLVDQAGRVRGILVISCDGRELLDAFRRAASTSAERIMLLTRDGESLKAQNRQGEWGFMIERRENFAARHRGAWARLQAAEGGQFEDDQGIWTFATVRPFVAGAKANGDGGQVVAAGTERFGSSGPYWKVVSRISPEQLAAFRTEVWAKYAPGLGFVLLLALFGSYRMARAVEERRVAARELRESHAELEQKVAERTALLAEREREHLRILEDSPFPIVVLRLADGVLDYGNPAFLSLLGIERGTVEALPPERLFVDPAEIEPILAALRQQGHSEGEVRLRAAGGRAIDALMAARLTHFASAPAVTASFVDITERKQAELAVADSRQRYLQLFEAESDAILLIENETGRILEANAAAARMYGYSVGELHDMTVWQLSAQPEETERAIRSTPFEDGGALMVPLRMHRHRDGAVIPVEITGRFFELGGQRVHIAAIRDISSRLATDNALREANAQLSQRLAQIEALQASLREQAIRDGLTGLFNRRFMEETCTRELARAQREGYPVAVAMFDLDLFKRVNDTYGHAAGDEVIIALARLLQQHARVSDTPCRFGGEEFVLLLPRVDLETAAHRVGQLRSAFAERSITFGAFQLWATVSAGVAAYPAHGLTTRELVAHADEALYAAKRAGRNRVEIFTSDAVAADRDREEPGETDAEPDSKR